jgi:hypothetical protein
MSKSRPFPLVPRVPGDDDTIIYKITGSSLDNSYLVIGETVHLSAEGIQVVASLDGSYGDQNAYTFVDDEGYDIGGLYGRDDAGQNIVGLRAVDLPAAGDDVLLQLVAVADPATVSTAKAEVTLAAERVGETVDTTISLERDDAGSRIDILTGLANGRVRVGPKLNLLGGSLELCDVYIKGSNFIIKYVDGGTTRYKYLDLSGTGTAWVQSTSEP